ncbi:beta-ketoacyl synthase chain length factor [Nevskia sp.]|uniref:beta-ketoacyl synthase chain length factor n=1 Tax=Nevskia sp. TaxID=1929292 RepID=UPI0025DE81CD|nr:beta-ketoacyl synthase chain length factor [Nevskia sp.]
MSLFVDAIGVAMPGLDGWPATAAVLRGDASWIAAALSLHAPNLLPPNERRRATAAVRLAFKVAEEAIAASMLPASGIASVFASSDADTDVIHRICTALARDGRTVSPTDFHNSVHNAAPGYWSIAIQSRLPSVSLSAWDGVFAAGLNEAAALVMVERLPVLLVCYDTTPPEPLLATRGLAAAGGVAFLLVPVRSAATIARLIVTPSTQSESVINDTALEALRLAGTATRALPLLQQLAGREPGRVVIAATGSRCIAIDIEPC